MCRTVAHTAPDTGFKHSRWKVTSKCLGHYLGWGANSQCLLTPGIQELWWVQTWKTDVTWSIGSKCALKPFPSEQSSREVLLETEEPWCPTWWPEALTTDKLPFNYGADAVSTYLLIKVLLLVFHVQIGWKQRGFAPNFMRFYLNNSVKPGILVTCTIVSKAVNTIVISTDEQNLC